MCVSSGLIGNRYKVKGTNEFLTSLDDFQFWHNFTSGNNFHSSVIFAELSHGFKCANLE